MKPVSLLAVLAGGAVVVTLPAYRFVPALMRKPVLEAEFSRHPSELNRDTIVGAAIFGAGWGLCGVCPGPAIAGLGAGNWPLLIALVGIASGALVQGRYFGRA